jgi:hypothetical protein
MNDATLLGRLASAYGDVPAPAPSAELARRMDAGWIGDVDDERTAVVVPLAPRPRMRMRYLVAAVVASFVAMSGLAVAGALPDDLQRQVNSFVSHVGIDLPDPTGTPHVPSGIQDRPGAAPASRSGGSTGSSRGAGDLPTAATSPAAAASGQLGGGSTPGSLAPSTTLPGSPSAPDQPPTTDLPPVTVPPIQLSPIDLPPIDPPLLAPIDVPPVVLPPVVLPEVPPLLPGLLPGL